MIKNPNPAPRYVKPPKTTGSTLRDNIILDMGMLIPYKTALRIAIKDALFNFKYP